MEQEFKMKSLGKAIKVLECFTTNTPELGVTEVSRKLNLQKSNIHDILTTFVQAGYMQQDKKTGKYSLTIKLLEYSFVINENMGYARLVYDILNKLSEDVQQIIYFSIPRGTDVFYVHSAYPQELLGIFPYRNIAGEKCPMYCSAMGKSMLAFSDENLMDQIKAVEHIQFTPTTIMTHELLVKEIDEVRRQGYSVDHAEHEFNVGAVAVPVFNRENKLIAAISACGLQENIDNNIVPYVKKLNEVSIQIRERL